METKGEGVLVQADHKVQGSHDLEPQSISPLAHQPLVSVHLHQQTRRGRWSVFTWLSLLHTERARSLHSLHPTHRPVYTHPSQSTLGLSPRSRP